MTAAEKYLRSLLDQNEYITEMIRHRDKLIERSRAIKTVDTSSERVQTSHNTDRICGMVTEITALGQEIEEENRKLWLRKIEFRELLRNVHDATPLRVLNQIYMQFKTVDQVAADLKHTKRWVIEKHQIAVEIFEKENKEFLEEWLKNQYKPEQSELSG